MPPLAAGARAHFVEDPFPVRRVGYPLSAPRDRLSDQIVPARTVAKEVHAAYGANDHP